MKLNEVNGVKFYSFDIFSEFEKKGILKHAFSTKFGGVSSGIYSSMNLHFREDKRENVLENYRRFCTAIGCDYKNVVFSNQVHKDNIYKVTKRDRGKGLILESDIKEVDALITNEKDLVLTTFYADCVPIFLYDKKNNSIGIAHSGWRGTVREIGMKTARKMQEEFGAEFENLIIGVAPSIGSCCFQVDEVVRTEFIQQIPYSIDYIYNDDEDGKYKIDLQEIIKTGFIKMGVLEENIEISGICTKCRQDMFFSHRAFGDDRGSLAGVMTITNIL